MDSGRKGKHRRPKLANRGGKAGLVYEERKAVPKASPGALQKSLLRLNQRLSLVLCEVERGLAGHLGRA